jgi:hypothetical protein
MANTLLEQTRQLHEDIECAERLVAKDLKRTMTRYKDRLQQDHRTKRFVDQIQENSCKLVCLSMMHALGWTSVRCLRLLNMLATGVDKFISYCR